MTRLYIKNMVCDRCKMVVDKLLQELGLSPQRIDLGEVLIEGELGTEKRVELMEKLAALGFELLSDRRQKTIELVKKALIRQVHHRDINSPLNISEYLSEELHQNYNTLSKLFSEVEGKTIERYYIELRIERVKELIRYDELSLSQIALQMNYSSAAYLSTQFKSVTGMTPSQFKALKENNRTSIDKV